MSARARCGVTAVGLVSDRADSAGCRLRRGGMAKPKAVLPWPGDEAGLLSPPGDARRPVVSAAQLERIYANYFHPIYGFIYSRVGNREDAEDLTSHVFMKSLQY